MDYIFALVLLICFIAFIVGMIKPKAIGMSNRLKAFLFTFISFFLILILWGILGNQLDDEALKNPETADELNFYLDDLTATPPILNKCKVLKKLSLKGNDITELDSAIFSNLKTLEELNISENPITVLPLWLLDFPNLKKLRFDDTQIDSVSPEFFEKIKSLSYNDTPYIQKEEVKATKLTASQKNRPKEGSESKEDSTESFGDFAWRKLSGKEHGDVIEFGNNEVFYIKPVKKEEAQKLGDFLTEMEFFSDENEASVQLLHNNINANYEVRFVINEDLLTDEVIAAFELYRIMIQRGVLDGKPTAVHLCNNRLVTIKTLREE